MPDLLSVSFITIVPKSCAGIPDKDPLKEPTAVLTADVINTSLITFPFYSPIIGNFCALEASR